MNKEYIAQKIENYENARGDAGKRDVLYTIASACNLFPYNQLAPDYLTKEQEIRTKTFIEIVKKRKV